MNLAIWDVSTFYHQCYCPAKQGSCSLQWRHNDYGSVSNHQPRGCLLYSDADQRKHQSSASLAFVRGIHRDRWIPRTKGQLRGKCFHLMTSSCIEIFWHLDTRANISFLSFVNCVFIHGTIIFYFLELYFTHWIGYLATLRYEVCNYLFVSWTKVHDAFYIFPECLVGKCTVNGSYWG